MLSLLFLGAIAGAFCASMVPVLLLGIIGWALSRGLGAVAAGAMSFVMMTSVLAIIYAMTYVVRDTVGGARDMAKMVAWAMSPALLLALCFACLFWRAAHAPPRQSSPPVSGIRKEN